MNRILSLLFLLLASSSAVSFAQQPSQTVRIGAWNIEHLGNPSSRAAPNTNVPQRASDIAAYIKFAKVDILGLEEISDDDGSNATRTNRTITQALQILRNQTGQIWRHVLFPKRDASDRHQLTGVLWNTGKAQLVGQPFKIPVETSISSGGASGEIWKRHPFAVKFTLGSGKTDLVLIVVHMKANTGGSPSPVRKREAEARTLVAQLAAIRSQFQDRDIVVLGDTNILNNDERADRILQQAGFEDLNEDDDSTHVGGAPFDRFYVPKNQPEFADSLEEIIAEEFLGSPFNPAAFRRRFSDHFMIVATIKVMADDDQ
jgi:predicted extracellular nuclease